MEMPEQKGKSGRPSTGLGAKWDTPGGRILHQGHGSRWHLVKEGALQIDLVSFRSLTHLPVEGLDLRLKIRTHDISCLFLFCQCFVSQSCSYLVMSLFSLFQSCPISGFGFCWFLAFLFPRLDMWVIDISAKGLEFREPFQDCNYMGFISIKGMI